MELWSTWESRSRNDGPKRRGEQRDRPFCTFLLGGQQKLGTQKGSGPDRQKEHCRASTRAKNRDGGATRPPGKGSWTPPAENPRTRRGKAWTNTHTLLREDHDSQTESSSRRERQRRKRGADDIFLTSCMLRDASMDPIFCHFPTRWLKILFWSVDQKNEFSKFAAQMFSLLHVIHCDVVEVAHCRKQRYRFQTRRSPQDSTSDRISRDPIAILRVGTGSEGIVKVVFTPVLESEVTHT